MKHTQHTPTYYLWILDTENGFCIRCGPFMTSDKALAYHEDHYLGHEYMICEHGVLITEG